MAPLFRKTEEQAGQEQAALAEIERLAALPAADLAVELLPALGAAGIPHARAGVRVLQCCDWLLASFPRASKFNPGQLAEPVREALQRLEHANLVTATPHDRISLWRITRDGQSALDQQTTAQLLAGGGSGTTP